MYHSFVQTEPFGFIPFSPFQTLFDLDMSHRSSSSQAYRHSMERTYSRDHTSHTSVGNGGSTGYTTDSAPRVSHKRTRSNSSASSHTNFDRPKHHDRNTWPVGPPPTPSTLQRSPFATGRNQSQTNLQLHRSLSNSPTTPSHIQRTHSNQSAPTLTRRLSRSSQHSRPILFYHKHEPHYGFTNFSNHGVKHEDRIYPTSEHLFQSLKFTHRPLLAEHIRTCDARPSVAFSEARRFQPEVRKDWKTYNIQAMELAIFLKFSQHEGLKDELLATGDAELIENSDKDAFWGCGPDGKGKNELGKALVRLRNKLRG